MGHIVVSNRNSGAIVAQAEVLEDGTFVWGDGDLSVEQKATLEAAMKADIAAGHSGGRLTGMLEWFEPMGRAES